jgi:hypothetical protein
MAWGWASQFADPSLNLMLVDRPFPIVARTHRSVEMKDVGEVLEAWEAVQ